MLDLVEGYFSDPARADNATVSSARRTAREPEAAVLIALTREPGDPEIILTQRAEHLNSHSGEVCFPGGKRDETDPDALFTALRETHEEIALPPDRVQILGALPVRTTRFLTSVAPFVGLVDKAEPLKANPEELDAVFRVPVSFFLDKKNLTRSRFTGRGYSINMPCYIFQGYRVWGFTLGLLADFLNDVFDAQIKLRYPLLVRALEWRGKKLDGSD